MRGRACPALQPHADRLDDCPGAELAGSRWVIARRGVDYLRERLLLPVLDNREHLLVAVPDQIYAGTGTELPLRLLELGVLSHGRATYLVGLGRTREGRTQLVRARGNNVAERQPDIRPYRPATHRRVEGSQGRRCPGQHVPMHRSEDTQGQRRVIAGSGGDAAAPNRPIHFLVGLF